MAENGFTPTAALLRAVLTAGAQPLTGISSSTGDSLEPPPSPFQGFGKVALWASLPLAGASNAPGLQVVNYALLRQGANHTYSISVTDSGQALSVVLAFQDWPSFSGARVSYVNDLDLEVTAPDGTQLFPNGRQSADPVNNVEKVRREICNRFGLGRSVNGCALSRQAFALLITMTENAGVRGVSQRRHLHHQRACQLRVCPRPGPALRPGRAGRAGLGRSAGKRHRRLPGPRGPTLAPVLIPARAPWLHAIAAVVRPAAAAPARQRHQPPRDAARFARPWQRSHPA